MRIRLIIDTDDLDTPQDLLDELDRAAGGEGITLTTAGGTFVVEAIGSQALGPVEGLVLNTATVDDVDQALDNLRALAHEEVPAVAASTWPEWPDITTLRRVLAAVEAVYLVSEQRFATSTEAARVTDALAGLLRHR